MTELEQKLLKALKASLEFEWVGLGAKTRMEEAERIVMDAEAAQAASDADGWIPWSGGECPVAFETKVDVRHRDGNEYQGFAGYSIARFWDDAGDPRDIIAYRIAKEPA